MRLLYVVFASVCAFGVFVLALLPKAPTVEPDFGEDDDEANIIDGRVNFGTRAVRAMMSSNMTTWKDEFRSFLRHSLVL